MSLNQSVFDTFPVLKSARLILREIDASDGLAIYQMRSNGRVNQFIPRPTMQTERQGEELALKTKDAFTQKKAIGWAGVLRDNKQIIGTCGFNSVDTHNRRAEIGGEMDVRYWGKHIAQEAVETIIQFGLEVMNLHTIEAKVSPDNRGAIYVLTQLGFVKEAHFKDRVYFNNQFDDMAVYTLHKENVTYHII